MKLNDIILKEDLGPLEDKLYDLQGALESARKETKNIKYSRTTRTGIRRI